MNQVDSEQEYRVALNEKADRWVPACGGKERPFITRNGRRVLYCFNPRSERHAYINLDTDTPLSDEELRADRLL